MISRKELFFQIVLHILVLLFYSFDRNDPGIDGFQIWSFLSYALAAAFITYYLMPRFLYRKKQWAFFGWVALVIFAVILIEEFILEQIFFAGTRRARIFPGIYFALFDVLPIIVILSGFKFGWDVLQKQRQIDELTSTIQESELQFLRSQINPHFLFNNLNNLYSHALENSAKTPEIILELSGVLRYMLYECKEKFVPLAKEIEQLHNFVKLNKLQIEERGKVNFNTQNIASDHKIAPLILIVFIENAFKHSQSGQSSNITIDIDLRLEGDTLKFYCKNNFKASEALDTVAKGIGLENVKKRLELLYPNKHRLDINRKDENFEVHLELELEKTKAQ
ncbi:sensor histidine kinase [Ulvibacterium marinum]|uniref:Histidine kinase n=1 Tax=Ulvibacterium marinum TaxID=2419782 RepID=A0A3B0C146_9FLAO|nr:histidine kinase [Ulvibacterium marinum]RKN79835.1 histidine kinase [Ulvibacterium marinum]